MEMSLSPNGQVIFEHFLSDVLKVQSGLAEADHRFIQALLNLAAAQADFDKAIGEDQSSTPSKR